VYPAEVIMALLWLEMKNSSLLPIDKFNDFMLGLRKIAETGTKMPLIRRMKPERKLHESYATIGKLMGMDVH